MKLNIAYPVTGAQKTFDIQDERRVRAFYEKRISQEVEGDSIGDEFKGYIFRISGGNDKQGFAMMQGVMTTKRVPLLLSKKHKLYRPRREGERRRKSVRGCIVDQDLSVLNLVVVKKGDNELPGITDVSIPKRLGPKRASKIRKLFGLSKEDDVKDYVLKRKVTRKDGKTYMKAPKIQRLVTPQRLHRKSVKLALKLQRREKSLCEAQKYKELLAMYKQPTKKIEKEPAPIQLQEHA